MTESIPKLTKTRRCFIWIRGLLPPLFLAAMIIVGACDFQLLEPPELPRWGFSLTIPLINRTYNLSELAENDTTISQDTTTNELQIEFSGTLDTTSIDSSLLQVSLPEDAAQQSINHTMDAPTAADIFEPVSKNVQVVIPLDSILEATGLPAFSGLSFPQGSPYIIPEALWDSVVTKPPVSPVTKQEGPFEIIDADSLLGEIEFIQTILYVQLSGTATSEFVTEVSAPDFPTSVDSIQIEASSGSYFHVVHQKGSLAPGSTFSKTTNMQSDSLGTQLDIALRMQMPDATGDVTIDPYTDPRIVLNITLTVGGVDSLAVSTVQRPLIEDEDMPDPFPLPGDIEIISGILLSGQLSPVNDVTLTGLRNTFPFDILFQLTFPNFDTSIPGRDSLTFGPYPLSSGGATINDTISLGGATVLNPAGQYAITEFEYMVKAEVLADTVVIPLMGGDTWAFQATFGMGDLHFSEITGNFSLSFDAVNTTIQDIPTGFAGFQLGRLSLALLLRNQIKLPVALNLRLIGRSLEGDSLAVPIVAYVNYPDPEGTAPDGTPTPVANGDTAYTLIILNESSVRTYWLPEGVTETSSAWWDTTVISEGETIVDVLNLPPDIIEVAGAAVIEGEGIVEAGKGIWGEFELIAPFAFVLPQDISFLPVDPIPWAPMDEDTREQIQTALLSASLTSQARTNFPIGGKISMLASNQSLFTLALDYLDDIAAGIPTAARTGDTTVYASLNSVLAADSIFNIDHVVFYPEEPSAGQSLLFEETRAQRVEFYTTQGDSFWIGHLFDMELPSPREVNDLGWVTTPGDTSQVITLDAERVGWIASDTTVYLKTFITLYSADGLRTIQSTNRIHFAAFITFNLASDILSEEEEPDSSEIEVTPIPNMTLALAATDTVYLDSVFTPPTGTELKDMDLAATTSHTGIATGTIKTSRTGGIRKYLLVTPIGPGTARITVSADDDPDDDIDPATTSFLVTVQEAGSESISPVPLPSVQHKIVKRARLW